MAITPPTAVDQISAAMSVCSLRHQVIASNIANRNAEGYQRLQLNFEQALDRTSTPRITAEAAATPVPIEQDLLDLTANSGRYQTLARVLNRYFALVATITGPTRG